jgi:hypothetical protein
MNRNFAVPMVLQDIDVTTLVDDTLFYPINPTGLEGAMLILHIVNLSDVDVFIGIGEKTKHIFIPADGEAVEIEFQRNSEPNNNDFLVKQGTVFYANGDGAQGTGNVFLSGWLRS